MAKVFDFLHATNEVYRAGRRAAAAGPVHDHARRTARSRASRCRSRSSAATSSRRMYASAPDDEHAHPALPVGQLFRRPLTRTGIDVPTRELLTFAMLVSLGGCEPQVKGHVAANLNVGNDRARLIDVITQLLPYIGYPRTLNALRVIDESSRRPST